MSTMDIILKELKEVPPERLDDLYAIVHSFKTDARLQSSNQNKILSFSDVFSNMSQDEYEAFVEETKNIRNNLFDRDPGI